jgi:hypothetical protein
MKTPALLVLSLLLVAPVSAQTLQPLPILVMDLAPGVNPLLIPDSTYSRKATDGTDLGATFDIKGVAARAISGIEAPMQAVPVKNPTTVTVPNCPDHDQDTGHEIDILDGAGVVVQTIAAGDPPAVSGAVTFAINIQPVKFGDYTVVVRATAGAVKSPNSPASDVWQRSPGAPGKAIVK